MGWCGARAAAAAWLGRDEPRTSPEPMQLTGPLRSTRHAWTGDGVKRRRTVYEVPAVGSRLARRRVCTVSECCTPRAPYCTVRTSTGAAYTHVFAISCVPS